MSKYKPITIVNEQNEVIGQSDLIAANECGLLRRTVWVFIFNTKSELLLQQRGATVLDPLLLDQSVGGHVDMGETYDETAVREVEEELGINGVALQAVCPPVRQRRAFGGLYVGIVPVDYRVQFDEREVASIAWMTDEVLLQTITKEPGRFVPRFIDTWQEHGDRIRQCRDEMLATYSQSTTAVR